MALSSAWKAFGIHSGPMRRVTLTRTETGEDGTFGLVVTDNGFSCYSLELAWKNNEQGVSCIPSGIYLCERAVSPKHGPCYYVRDVPKRTDIELHAANWARQLLGCISLGRAIGDIADTKAVLSSRDAIAGFEADLDGEPFKLDISWRPGIGPNPS